MTVIPYEERIIWWGTQQINDGHVCIKTGHSNSCSGDSGGPLACVENGDWVLVGATSFGIADCRYLDYPSVYAKIAYFHAWIMTRCVGSIMYLTWRNTVLIKDWE